jgi:mono/diheme cytochrome c family protein
MLTLQLGAGVAFAMTGTLLVPPAGLSAQDAAEVTFTRDVAPILQSSCQQCHRAGGVAPMSLETYQEVRRYASRIRERTGIRDRAGAMPPWYVEKDIGIQHYKYDPSLSDEEIATIATWVDSGAPEGDPADMPAPVEWNDDIFWTAGEPDLVVETEEIFMEAGAPDWWGEIESVPIPLEEDRYVASVEIREVNDIDPTDQGRQTVGGRYIFHHMIWGTRTEDGDRTGWPVHEVGRNPDVFDSEAGRLLHAGSSVASNSVHLHSSGRDTRAKLLIGFRFHPEGYEPKYPGASVTLGNAMDIDIDAMTDGQELHAYEVLEQHTKFVTFEPHLHAPGERMCIESIWGYNVETLACVGYDHNWVRGYAFEDGYQPLLPKGTVVHIIGYMNNTPSNTNVPDPRNWSGSGNRSVSNMFIDLGMQVRMTDEEFLAEMQARVERFDLTKNDNVIGCPLCLHAIPVPSPIRDDAAQDAGGGLD